MSKCSMGYKEYNEHIFNSTLPWVLSNEIDQMNVGWDKVKTRQIVVGKLLQFTNITNLVMIAQKLQ